MTAVEILWSFPWNSMRTESMHIKLAVEHLFLIGRRGVSGIGEKKKKSQFKLGLST